jgi:hypothetical protein
MKKPLCRNWQDKRPRKAVSDSQRKKAFIESAPVIMTAVIMNLG